jgi:hypothetical protein
MHGALEKHARYALVEWLFTQEGKNHEDAAILGAAARYRRLTAGSSNDHAQVFEIAVSFLVHIMGMRF